MGGGLMIDIEKIIKEVEDNNPPFGHSHSHFDLIKPLVKEINKELEAIKGYTGKDTDYDKDLDAKRWRFYSDSPETALSLGSKLNPNDETIDWARESNRLVDELILIKHINRFRIGE
jgi:hypothetical protein